MVHLHTKCVGIHMYMQYTYSHTCTNIHIIILYRPHVNREMANGEYHAQVQGVNV